MAKSSIVSSIFIFLFASSLGFLGGFSLQPKAPKAKPAAAPKPTYILARDPSTGMPVKIKLPPGSTTQAYCLGSNGPDKCVVVTAGKRGILFALPQDEPQSPGGTAQSNPDPDSVVPPRPSNNRDTAPSAL